MARCQELCRGQSRSGSSVICRGVLDQIRTRRCRIIFRRERRGRLPTANGATKPEVWSEHDKFLAADKKVGDQVAALDVALKSGDKAKVEVAFKDLNICNGCHDTFRAKLQ